MSLSSRAGPPDTPLGAKGRIDALRVYGGNSALISMGVLSSLNYFGEFSGIVNLMARPGGCGASPPERGIAP